jgi:hypothetical protein
MLTEGWKSHSSVCGNVPPSRDPTVPGMALQCPGWWHSGGDGRTGAEVTEKTCPAGLMSQHRPARARGRHPYLFQGFRRPPSRGATWRSYESRRHSVTELTPALPHSSRTVSGWPHKAGWRNNTGIQFPGGVRAQAWRGFAFDPCARVVSQHLMLWLGEWRGGASSGRPRARRRFT